MVCARRYQQEEGHGPARWRGAKAWSPRSTASDTRHAREPAMGRNTEPCARGTSHGRPGTKLVKHCGNRDPERRP